MPLPANIVNIGFGLFFDTELVRKVICDLKGGKAPDLARFTAEHLQRTHPILPVILSKFFQLNVMDRHVPDWFGRTFIFSTTHAKRSVHRAISAIFGQKLAG